MAIAAKVYIPDQGDIVWLIFDPRVGHEQSGRRPALVLSPRLVSEHTGLAIVCPITSRVRELPFEITLSRTETQGAVLPLHVRSVDVAARKAKFIERAPQTVTRRVLDVAQALIGAV